MDEAFYNLVREIRRYNKDQSGGSNSPGGGNMNSNGGGGNGGGGEYGKGADEKNTGCCGGCIIL